LLDETALGDSSLPVVVLSDGRALADPSNTEISDALGATTLAERECDLVIVGAGPGGPRRRRLRRIGGLRTVVVERDASADRRAPP